ncbi:MAG: beta-galactosidase GalB [Luteolibacter sp.]|uniref:beta-galactosidase GalB n=1 Tax=Luteolibacter sp. TaxID=1962973 RepID=UPI00326785B2
MIPRIALLAALLAAALLSADAAGLREVERINDGWRFTKGDPPDVNPADLLYDVRPVATGGDQKERLAEATEDAAKLSAATHRVLKPWILPTGNRFIKDPAKRFVRPDGNPGGDVSYVKSDFDDSGWRRLNLPHDWAIEGPFNSANVGGGMGRLPSPGIAWYRRQLDIPVADKGKSIFLEVDGAMAYSAVWLNGQLLGGWPYGYSSWRLDLTQHVVPGGKNQLAIRLDNPPDFSRWYPGAGIYRNVWLTKTRQVHVGQWGTFLTTPQVSAASATIELVVTVDNDSNSDADAGILTEIFALDADGNLTGNSVASIKSMETSVTAGASARINGSVVLPNPKLWGPPPQQQPDRYVAVTTVSRNGEAVDRYETRFGIRSVECQPDGLFVNGQRITIQGVNQHHDLGALGAAFNERAAERQLEILRELGCNAIRMAHNPPAPELLELTDRMGFLVVDEVFDAWLRQKTPFDFHLIFADWHEQDLRSMICRDRNHASVILWSVGNEVGEQYTGAEGAEVTRKMIALSHDADPSRPATASMNFAKSDSPFAAAVDVISLNYQGEGIRDTPEFDNFKGIRTQPQYPVFHEKFSDKMIVSSESAAALSSRGVYLFPVTKGGSNPTRDGSGGDSTIQQVSAYELHTADFGSSADKVFAMQDKNPFVAGEFVWSGWDYLGEPTPYYSARSSYFGIIDLAGFRKDRFYLYQSRWRPDLPMAHILPHWTWPERVGQVTPVHVFTSGDEAELFLNGKSLGRKKKGAFEYRLRWDDVIYQPGELKLVAYKDGKPWAGSEIRTTSAAARLELAPDRASIRADGSDLSFITVRVTDGNGLTSPRAQNTIRFKIEGPGEIVATDNGDPTCLISFPSHERPAFNGLGLVIVRSIAGRTGPIRLSAESESLQRASVTLTSENPH